MIIPGTITKTMPDGSQVTADYLIDTEDSALVQVGGDAEIDGEGIPLIFAMMHTDHEGDSPDDL